MKIETWMREPVEDILLYVDMPEDSEEIDCIVRQFVIPAIEKDSVAKQLYDALKIADSVIIRRASLDDDVIWNALSAYELR
jgi:hypothetical protein